MKKLTFISIFTFLILSSQSQSLDVSYSSPENLEVKSFGLKLAGADNDHLYFFEKKTMGASGFFSGVSTPIPKITKYNRKNLQLVSSKEYKKENKNYWFFDMQWLKGRMYLFFAKLRNNDKELAISAVEVDKNSLEPIGDVKELTSFEYEQKDYRFKLYLTPSADSNSFQIFCPLNKNTDRVGVRLVNLDLKLLWQCTIAFPSNDSEFKLKQLLITRSNRIVVAGVLNQIKQEGKKNYSVFFKDVVAQVYDNKGNKLKAISCSVDSLYLFNPYLFESEVDKLMIAGYWWNSQTGGIGLIKADLLSGVKEVQRMTAIDKLNNSNGDDPKKIAEYFFNNREFSINYVNFDVQNNSLIIAGDDYSEFVHVRNDRSAGGGNETVVTTDNYYKNILLVNLPLADTKAGWVNIIPKEQYVQTLDFSPRYHPSLWSDNYKSYGVNNAYICSFSVVENSSGLYILFNDNEANDNVTSFKQEAKRMFGTMRYAPCMLYCDKLTGKFIRKQIKDAPGKTVPMFMRGYLYNGEFYFPARSHAGFSFSKFDYSIGKAVLK